MTAEEFALFQKLNDERYERLIDEIKGLKETFIRDMSDVKKDVRETRNAQIATDKVVSNLMGRWAVWGAIGLVVGGAVATALVKGLGI